MPTLPNWVTIAITGIGTAAPILMTFIPPPYQAAASGILGAVGAIWHLYTPKPKPSPTLK